MEHVNINNNNNNYYYYFENMLTHTERGKKVLKKLNMVGRHEIYLFIIIHLNILQTLQLHVHVGKKIAI